MKPTNLGFLFLLIGVCVAFVVAIGQGEHDDTTIVRPTHPKAHAATHEASSDPNQYVHSGGSFSERTFPVYDKETAKLQKLQHEASLYREALRNVNSDGTVLVKAPAAEIESKLAKAERKLFEKESKKKVKGYTYTYKEADPVTRAQFDEYYRESLAQNHQSACLAFYDLKNQERLYGLSFADRAKMKIDQVRCKVEKSELFQKFMGTRNPEGDGYGYGEHGYHGDHGDEREAETFERVPAGGYHGNVAAGEPDAERVHEPVQRTTRTTVTKTTRHVIKKPKYS